MEQQPISTARIALKWGIITGLADIIYSTILNVTDMFMNTGLQYVSYLIILIGIILAMRDFKANNGGFMSYGQGLGIGSLLGAITGFLASAYNFIYAEFIDTTMRQRMMDGVRQQLEEKGTPEEQIDMSMQMIEKMSNPAFTFAFGVIGFGLFGLIVALIAAAIIKKDKDTAPF